MYHEDNMYIFNFIQDGFLKFLFFDILDVQMA